MSKEDRYYGCYECASNEGDGCVIFQIGINPRPVCCPCGYGYPKFTLITDKIKEMLISQSANPKANDGEARKRELSEELE